MIFQRLPFLIYFIFWIRSIYYCNCDTFFSTVACFWTFSAVKARDDLTVLYSGHPGPHTELQIRSGNDAGLSQQLLESCSISGLVWSKWGYQRHLHWQSNWIPCPLGRQCFHLHHPRHFCTECPSCLTPPNLPWFGTGTELCWLGSVLDVKSDKLECSL